MKFTFMILVELHDTRKRMTEQNTTVWLYTKNMRHKVLVNRRT